MFKLFEFHIMYYTMYSAVYGVVPWHRFDGEKNVEAAIFVMCAENNEF